MAEEKTALISRLARAVRARARLDELIDKLRGECLRAGLRAPEVVPVLVGLRP